MRPRRLELLAAAGAESAWVTALVVVPVFFNPYTAQVFEPDKVALFRASALALALALVVWTVERRGAGTPAAGRRWWRLPLVKPVLVLLVTVTASTALSVAPATSFWGTVVRAQGTYTWLCYLIVFAAIVMLVHRREQIERMVDAIILASVPVAVYGLIQHLGYDPIDWETDPGRIHGTAGNPIFIGAYLIMVVPLTLARLLDRGAGAEACGKAHPGSRSRTVLRASAYTLLLAAQLLAIVFSQSRGPVVGLGAGLTLFFVLFGVHRRRRWLSLVSASSAGVVAGGLLLLNLGAFSLPPLVDGTAVGRLGRLLDVAQDTARVRVLLWQSATRLLAANPSRSIIGYGPETISLVFARVYPPELAHYEEGDRVPDRSHNEIFDALITTGVLGALAELALVLSFFAYVLRRLGIADRARGRPVFLALVACGALAGVWAPRLVDGTFRFSSVGLAAGGSAALLLFVVGRAASRPTPPHRYHAAGDLLLIGLASAVLAHFVEVQFGIATAGTRLYFWSYLGMAVAIGTQVARDRPDAGGTADNHALRTGAVSDTSLVVSLILIVLTFDFSAGPQLAPHGGTIVLLGMTVWLAGALLVAGTPNAPPPWFRWVGVYAASTTGFWLLFFTAHRAWVGWPVAIVPGSVDGARVLAARYANVTSVVYAFVFLTLVCRVWIEFQRCAASVPAPTPVPTGRTSVYALLLAGTVWTAVATNLDLSRADALSRYARAYERQHMWHSARVIHEDALRLRPPAADHYLSHLARSLVEEARSQSQAQTTERDVRLARAIAALQTAREINPLETDHLRNLAQALRSWGLLVEDPDVRRQHLGEAAMYLQQAVDLNPTRTAIQNELGEAYLELGQAAAAERVLRNAAAIDARNPDTLALLGRAYVGMGALGQALEAYERGLALDPRLVSAWTGKADVLAGLGRMPEAIDAGRRAVSLADRDPGAHYGLARLYQRTGQNAHAHAEALAALAVAGPDQRPVIDRLIAEVLQPDTPGGTADAPGVAAGQSPLD